MDFCAETGTELMGKAAAKVLLLKDIQIFCEHSEKQHPKVWCCFRYAAVFQEDSGDDAGKFPGGQKDKKPLQQPGACQQDKLPLIFCYPCFDRNLIQNQHRPLMSLFEVFCRYPFPEDPVGPSLIEENHRHEAESRRCHDGKGVGRG